MVIFLFLTCFILWLAPNVRLDWTVVGYIFYCKVFFIAILTIDYYLKRKWWLSLATEKEPPSLQEYLNTAEKEEELLVQTYINGLLQEHQQTMQQAINNQQDQKDYIDSWVHEIKVP